MWYILLKGNLPICIIHEYSDNSQDEQIKFLVDRADPYWEPICVRVTERCFSQVNKRLW